MRLIIGVLLLSGCAAAPMTPGSSPAVTAGASMPRSTTAASSSHSPAPVLNSPPVLRTAEPLPSPSTSPTVEPRPTVGCGPTVASLIPLACTGPPPIPTETATPQHELPEGLSEMPQGSFTVEIAPRSRPGTLQIGVPITFPLAHCGLFSPVDVDGSLWDAKYGHDGHGGPISTDESGDLINEGRVTFRLRDRDVAEMTTRDGLVVTLWRHDGPRRYELCS